MLRRRVGLRSWGPLVSASPRRCCCSRPRPAWLAFACTGSSSTAARSRICCAVWRVDQALGTATRCRARGAAARGPRPDRSMRCVPARGNRYLAENLTTGYEPVCWTPSALSGPVCSRSPRRSLDGRHRTPRYLRFGWAGLGSTTCCYLRPASLLSSPTGARPRLPPLTRWRAAGAITRLPGRLRWSERPRPALRRRLSCRSGARHAGDRRVDRPPAIAGATRGLVRACLGRRPRARRSAGYRLLSRRAAVRRRVVAGGASQLYLAAGA